MAWRVLLSVCVVALAVGCDRAPGDSGRPGGSDQTLADPPSKAESNPHALNALPLAVPASDDAGRGQPPAEIGKATRGPLYGEAVEALRRGDTASAIDKLQRCVEMEPGNALCHRGLGIAFARAFRSREAVQAYRRYLEVAPTAPDAQQVEKLLRDYEAK